MGAALGDVIPLALTVAIVPVSIICLILLLLSRRARTNSTAFTGGRILGLAVIVGLALAVAAGRHVEVDPGSSPVLALVKVLLGIVLVLASVRRWRRQRKDRGEPRLPPWMARLDDATPALSLGAGVLISTAEPLTLVFAIDAGLSTAQAELSFASTVVVVAVFVLVATATNIAILLLYLAGANRAEPRLTSMRGWINANHESLSTVLLFILGVILIGRGVPGISA